MMQMLAIGATCFAYAPVAHWCTRSRGEHLEYAIAKDRIPLALPSGARDIRFYQHLHPDRVLKIDFEIGEKEYLEWAASQGCEARADCRKHHHLTTIRL